VWFRSHLDGSSHFLSPERAVEVQLALGADIIMTLDECVEYPASHETLQRAVALTKRWAERAKALYKAKAPTSDPKVPGTRCPAPASDAQPDTPHLAPDTFPTLFGIVQGGTDKDLRRQSAESLVGMDFEGYAVGGLAVGEPKSEMYETAELTAGLLPRERPRYLMGVGTPEDLLEGVACGIDMFDCVMPSRNARNACAFTSEGKIGLRNARFARDEGPLDPVCGCAVCRRYSRAYLRHLFISGEMLGAILATHHNIHFYLDTMRKIRQSLLLGEFPEFQSKMRARS